MGGRPASAQPGPIAHLPTQSHLGPSKCQDSLEKSPIGIDADTSKQGESYSKEMAHMITEADESQVLRGQAGPAGEPVPSVQPCQA